MFGKKKRHVRKTVSRITLQFTQKEFLDRLGIPSNVTDIDITGRSKDSFMSLSHLRLNYVDYITIDYKESEKEVVLDDTEVD